MRLAIAQPCFGSSETVLRIKRSSVPWTKSFGFAILWLSTIGIVDCQGGGCNPKGICHGNETNRSLRSVWFAASPSNGVTWKIS